MKNPHHPTGNQTHDLPACSVVPQPTVPPHAPLHLVKSSISCKENYQPDIHYAVISLHTLLDAQ
jgi:hypothetical protein